MLNVKGTLYISDSVIMQHVPIPADPEANNIPKKTFHKMGIETPHVARPG